MSKRSRATRRLTRRILDAFPEQRAGSRRRGAYWLHADWCEGDMWEGKWVNIHALPLKVQLDYLPFALLHLVEGASNGPQVIGSVAEDVFLSLTIESSDTLKLNRRLNRRQRAVVRDVAFYAIACWWEAEPWLDPGAARRIWG